MKIKDFGFSVNMAVVEFLASCAIIIFGSIIIFGFIEILPNYRDLILLLSAPVVGIIYLCLILSGVFRGVDGLVLHFKTRSGDKFNGN